MGTIARLKQYGWETVTVTEDQVIKGTFFSDQETEMMKCDWCGNDFPADARACVEAGISASHPPEEGEEWKVEESLALNPEEFSQEQRDQLKAEMQLDDTQLDELLRTGTVKGLGAIVCLECQDAGE